MITRNPFFYVFVTVSALYYLILNILSLVCALSLCVLLVFTMKANAACSLRCKAYDFLRQKWHFRGRIVRPA